MARGFIQTTAGVACLAEDQNRNKSVGWKEKCSCPQGSQASLAQNGSPVESVPAQLHSASPSSCSLPGLLCWIETTLSCPSFLKCTACKAVRCDTVLPRFGEQWEAVTACIAGHYFERKVRDHCSYLGRSLTSWCLWGLASQPPVARAPSLQALLILTSPISFPSFLLSYQLATPRFLLFQQVELFSSSLSLLPISHVKLSCLWCFSFWKEQMFTWEKICLPPRPLNSQIYIFTITKLNFDSYCGVRIKVEREDSSHRVVISDYTRFQVRKLYLPPGFIRLVS